MVKNNRHAAVCAIMLALSMPITASAFPITATICVDVDIDLDDADLSGDENFYADNGAKNLRGVRIKLEEDFGTGSQTQYADWTGANAGCASFSNVSTTPGQTYTAKIRSDFSVRNSTIEVRMSASPQGMMQQTFSRGFSLPKCIMPPIRQKSPSDRTGYGVWGRWPGARLLDRTVATP
jgi:hypothetical protein